MNICHMDAPFSVILCTILGIFMLNKTYACSNFMVANLTDDRLSSSSIHNNDENYHPKHGRLWSTTGWVPGSKLYDDNPWIQADFGRVVRITAVVTKGNGYVFYVAWVEEYQVKYSNNLIDWKSPYNAHGGCDRSAEGAYSSVTPDPAFAFVEGPCCPTLDFVFIANTDSFTAVRNDFPSAVEARYLRLYPTICSDICSLRFGVVGCEVTTTSTTTTSTTTHAPTTTHPTTSATTTHAPTTTHPTIYITTTHAPTTTHTTTSTTTTHAPTTIHPTISTTTTDELMTTDPTRTSITAPTGTDPTTSTTTTHASATTIAPTTSISTTTFSQTTTYSTVEEPCPCVCVKKNNFTMTQAELHVRLLDIVKNLTVPKNTTSRFIRSKISVQDNRPEVLYVGSVSIVLLIVVVSVIVLPDLFTFSRFLFLLFKKGVKHD